MGLLGSRLQRRITIPFTVLLIVAIVATAAVSVTVVSRVLERRFDHQLRVAAELLSRSDFAENRLILDRLKTIVDADILTLDAGGSPVTGTLPAAAEGEWAGLLASRAQVDEPPGKNGSRLERVDFGGRRYTVVHRELRDVPGARIVFLKTNEDLAQAVRSIARPIALLAVALMVLITLVSVVITRGITSPLQVLVRGARRLGGGDWGALAEVTEVRTGDEVGELAVAFRDMAVDLRRAEQRLLHSEKLAVTGQLAARVAHDIRNPLSSIKVRAQLVCDRLEPGDERLRWLEPLLEEIDQVEWVVQGLLETARPGELRLETSDLNEIVAGVLRALAARLEHARIEVEADLAPGLPVMLLDPDRLRLALVNVILNAVEAMPKGGRLEVATALAPDETATVEIRDEGDGIEASVRDRLFDPFFTTKRDGVGLGLVNAKHIVESHAGTIELLGRGGGGTRVLIRIPLRAADATSVDSPAAAGTSDSPGA